MKNLFLLTILFLFIGFQSMDAQTSKGTLLLGGSGSFQSVNDQSVLSISPNIGYFVRDKIVVGTSASFVNFSEVSSISFGPYVRGYFMTSEKGSLFAQAGYNFIRVSNDDESESDSGFGLGLGYAIFLNPSVALELSGNYSRYGFSNNSFGGLDDTGVFSINAGFQIHFKK